MKQTTQKIKVLLEDDDLFQDLETLQNKDPDYTHQEITMQEAYERFTIIRTILLEGIEKGLFDDIPFARRNAMLNNLTSIKQYRKNISQFLTQFNSFYSQYVLTKLSDNLNNNLDNVSRTKELEELKAKYAQVLKSVDKSEEIKKHLESSLEKSNDVLKKLNTTNETANKIELELNKVNKQIAITKNSVEATEQDIENRKKEILAFAKNIEKNEEILLDIQHDLKIKIEDSIKANIAKAKNLINEAEQALELKQTEGISKAYSSRLDKLNKENTKSQWLIGSISFVVITLIIGYLLTGGSITLGKLDISFSASDNIAFIIGRVMLTGIGISGAVFCANRYVHIKNLEEDYEYKVVLSKSILAFSNKIKELDKGKLAEYLTKVLHDLHQDPLRERKSSKKEKVNFIKIDQLQDIIDKIKN